MRLPQPKEIRYQTDLPCSGKSIDYRPYNVAEEKILLTAVASEDPKLIESASIQVIEAACNIDVGDLHPTDLEWLYIKLRVASVGANAVINMQVNCETEECPRVIKCRTNLDKNVEFRGIDELIEAGFVKKDNGWLIMFDDSIGVIFDIKASKKDKYEEILHDCLVCIIDGDNVIEKSDIKVSDLEEWVSTLGAPHASKIELFFRQQPYLVLPVVGQCPKCGATHKSEVRGILDFFE